MTQYDAVIIGAGHNGLTAANYLAMGGLKVCVLERRHIVGGAAVTEEFHPGYRNSIASYVVSLLRPEVVEELELKKHGYQPMRLKNSFYPDLNGEYLLLNDDDNHNRREYEKFSKTDYDAQIEYHGIVDKLGAILSKQWLKEPPKLHGGGLTDLISAAKSGMDIYKLDKDTRYRMVQFFIGAPDSIIERWFESDKIKAMIASHCIPANYISLHNPGASLSMLHHSVGELDGHHGAWGIVKGGMGAITQAMAKSAMAKGVEIRTDAAVKKIIVENGVAKGVMLENGKAILARVVATNADPKGAFLNMIGKEHLPETFAKDIAAIRQESASLRMNLALSGLPDFACLPGTEIGEHHKSSISFIDGKDHIERAYRSARAGIPSDPPIIESIIPSASDDTLTDEPGTHVMSLLCKYMPYELADGKNWDDEKERVVKNILDHLTKYIPNLPDILVGWQCLTPLDLERIFGLPRGDICHGKLEPDQLYSVRPHPDAAQYATPVKGFYLCGSGTHPGGGVTGAPGRNAAKRILKDI
ncbi:phytoene desaturase family protein [Pseudemcibacter aquimaris]|uniref:phytoene desaturase family protein n=1 Tax=Pseudemcibacter aquimaris TaxID=2857064 RepID=UPI002010F223|nr:NAD(P)/FAD-dependent oxidoreductase [Pseudemcibacter aquimaris]MCC3860946.1 NAD(P)/FAD-dependent oxidoreductase [Pseudemcibacter aquimaris]WDU59765.1 NAD(P)/FAD-dependent oxidoreductase [Pseudemcibacter aquimaris]